MNDHPHTNRLTIPGGCVGLTAILIGGVVGANTGLAIFVVGIVLVAIWWTGLFAARLYGERAERRRIEAQVLHNARIARVHEADASARTAYLLDLDDERRIKAAVEAALAKLPPPEKPKPTADELAAAALVRYQAAVRRIEVSGLDPIELEAAKKAAKAKYLRELDSVQKGI